MKYTKNQLHEISLEKKADNIVAEILLNKDFSLGIIEANFLSRDIAKALLKHLKGIDYER